MSMIGLAVGTYYTSSTINHAVVPVSLVGVSQMADAIKNKFSPHSTVGDYGRFTFANGIWLALKKIGGFLRLEITKHDQFMCNRHQFVVQFENWFRTTVSWLLDCLNCLYESINDGPHKRSGSFCASI